MEEKSLLVKLDPWSHEDPEEAMEEAETEVEAVVDTEVAVKEEGTRGVVVMVVATEAEEVVADTVVVDTEEEEIGAEDLMIAEDAIGNSIYNTIDYLRVSVQVVICGNIVVC